MKQRRDELVQFISRGFGLAAVALIVGSGVLLTLVFLRNADGATARASRETTRLARELVIIALERQSALRGNSASGLPLSGASLRVDDAGVKANIDSLGALTAAEPDHRLLAERIANGFAKWDSLLARSLTRAPDGALTLTPSAAGNDVSETFFTEISESAEALVASEDGRYALRSDGGEVLDRVIAISAVSAIALMLLVLFRFRQRLLHQARDQAVGSAALDLRNAQLIDQTRQMEQMIDALQQSETRFRTLVGSLHDVVFTLGHEKRFTGMFGGNPRSDEERIDLYRGKTSSEILGPEIGRIHDEAADRALRGETFTYDWSLEQGGAKLHYTATVSPLRGPGGEIRGVVGINRDITEKVTREDALSEAREQLKHAQRLDALGQLAGGVAHDFNNLLTVIMTYAAILQEDAASGSDEARSIEEIRLASERAAALTRQLLAFSRRQVLQPRAINLNDVVRDVERMLTRIIPPDIVFETVLAEPLGSVMADPGQIEQVLVNLALNARDAMPGGGRLTMSTALVDSPHSDHNGSAPGLDGAHVLVTVRDTGTGIPPEVMARVFEPFFTTKSVGKGTGLGLATVHGIVEQSGGHVTVESEVGSGTTFYIRLPRIADRAPPPALAATTTEGLRGTERVLLVDDNEELRRVVKRMLAKAGYEVLEASNGVGALAQLDRGIVVDMVLSDVMMPEMGGRAVADAIRQRHPDVKVLMMSGYNYDTALRGMAQRGDVAFIEKPFTAEKLLRRIREVLGRQATGST